VTTPEGDREEDEVVRSVLVLGRARWKTKVPASTRIATGLLALTLLPGRGTVRLEAPEGRKVRILPEDAPASIRIQRTVWYCLWGGSPISDNTTKQDIEQHDLKEVRIHTEQTLLEGLTNPITAVVSIVRRTLIVEGNP